MTSWRRAAAALSVLSVVAPPSLFAQDRSRPLPVPYVSQSEQLCGGAAVAMVLRYYGARGVMAEEFSALVEPKAGGIRVRRLVDAVVSRGWRAVALQGSATSVREQLDKGQPVIALISVGHNRFHYVVITGWTDREVVAHDPAVAPDRTYSIEQFENAWAGSDRTIVVITPTARPSIAESSGDGRSEAHTAPSLCDSIVEQAVERAHAGDAAAAEQHLRDAADACPNSSSPLRELAGLRLTQSRFQEAVTFAEHAVELDAADAEAWRVLGASAYLDHRPDVALNAWNHVGEPRLDLVRVEGLDRSHYSAVAQMIDLRHGAVITNDDVDLARRRIGGLPASAVVRVDVEPRGQGTAEIDVAVVERPTFPRSLPEAALVAVRAGVDREVGLAANNLTGFGDSLSFSYRWWHRRPETTVSFAAPGLFGTHAIWRIDASWATQPYADGGPTIEEHRRRAALAVGGWGSPHIRWELSSGIDRWESHGAFAFAGGLLAYRSRDDTRGIQATASAWGGEASFGVAELAADYASTADAIGWRLVANLGVAAATTHAVMDVWPGAGTGHAREAFLRAHPLLDDGVITGGAFGRGLEHATLELQRWPRSARLWNIGVAGFVDAAAAHHRLTTTSRGQFADIGAGLRFRTAWLPGTLRIDFAHGLSDRASAVSVGLSLNR